MRLDDRPAQRPDRGLLREGIGEAHIALLPAHHSDHVSIGGPRMRIEPAADHDERHRLSAVQVEVEAIEEAFDVLASVRPPTDRVASNRGHGPGRGSHARTVGRIAASTHRCSALPNSSRRSARRPRMSPSSQLI